MNVMTLREAKQNLEHLVTRVLADAEPTIVVSDSREKVVVVRLDEYNSWKETLYLLSTPANAAHLRKSIAEAQSGATETHELFDV